MKRRTRDSIIVAATLGLLLAFCIKPAVNQASDVTNPVSINDENSALAASVNDATGADQSATPAVSNNDAGTANTTVDTLANVANTTNGQQNQTQVAAVDTTITVQEPQTPQVQAPVQNVVADVTPQVVQPVKDTTPVVDEPQTDNQTPANDETQTDNQTPANDETQTDDQKPADDETQTDDQKPADDETQTDDQTPADDETQTDDQTPATDETPVVDHSAEIAAINDQISAKAASLEDAKAAQSTAATELADAYTAYETSANVTADAQTSMDQAVAAQTAAQSAFDNLQITCDKTATHAAYSVDVAEAVKAQTVIARLQAYMTASDSSDLYNEQYQLMKTGSLFDKASNTFNSTGNKGKLVKAKLADELGLGDDVEFRIYNNGSGEYTITIIFAQLTNETKNDKFTAYRYRVQSGQYYYGEGLPAESDKGNLTVAGHDNLFAEISFETYNSAVASLNAANAVADEKTAAYNDAVSAKADAFTSYNEKKDAYDEATTVVTGLEAEIADLEGQLAAFN